MSRWDSSGPTDLVGEALGRGVSDPVEHFLHGWDADQEHRAHRGGQGHQQVACREQQLLLHLRERGGGQAAQSQQHTQPGTAH